MSYLARLFWTVGNDTEIDKALSQHYILTYLENNHVDLNSLSHYKQ